ncbi:MAG TPA: hypothetical protein VMW38_21750 [Terriglobia bacterium]|nr:hypothetical protein [Terriglobia bacterium]
MSISILLDSIWLALRGNGGGVDFVVVYSALGAIIWGFLLFKVFLQEGLQVAMGHPSELPRILVKYLFIAGMFGIWPQLSGHLFDAIKILASQFYPDLNKLLDGMAGSISFVSATDQAASNTQGITSTILGTLYNFTIGSLLSLVGIWCSFSATH